MTTSTTAYRVGDFVYLESPIQGSPYNIRRIDELNKTANGNVDAKVMCFFRRRDLPASLVVLADKHQQGGLDGESNGSGTGPWGLNASENQLTNEEKYQLQFRELFLSRRSETVSASLIRGRCSVTLLNETESLSTYLKSPDMFFYCLVYEPVHRTLLADKGEIRVGNDHQVDHIPSVLKPDETDQRSETTTSLETLVWTPNHSLTDTQIDQFLVISRSVGTFARALDCPSTVKQPSLHMSAAAASRDITLFHAMDTIHKNSYNLSNALSSLIPSSGPVLCRDEMEEWSASEANLFEEALEKYGKDFNDIRQDFIPWKSLNNIVEYYYMWKTTDRYVQQKRVKAAEAESKLKQVYIPNYNNNNASQPSQSSPSMQPLFHTSNLGNKSIVNGTTGSCGYLNLSSNGREPAPTQGCCDLCKATSSSQWYPFHDYQLKICHSCWTYWKRYGGFIAPHELSESESGSVVIKKKVGPVPEENDKTALALAAPSHRPYRCTIPGCDKEFKLRAHLGKHYATSHNLPTRTGSPRPIMKTRTAFYLHASFLTRASRRLCPKLVPSRHIGRSPFSPINVPTFKVESQALLVIKTMPELKELFKQKRRERGSVTGVANRLALSRNNELVVPDFLAPTHKDKLPKLAKIAFPKPPKGPDGSLLYERIPNVVTATDLVMEKAIVNNLSLPSSNLKKRHYEQESNGIDISITGVPPPSKRVQKEPMFIPPQPAPPPSLLIAAPADVALALTPPAALANAIAPAIIPPVPAVKIAPVVMNGGTRSRGNVMGRPGRKHLIPWNDAPDDLYFRSTFMTKGTRKKMPIPQLRRAARKPWRTVL